MGYYSQVKVSKLALGILYNASSGLTADLYSCQATGWLYSSSRASHH